MDFFQKIAKEQPVDFRVFQSKKPQSSHCGMSAEQEKSKDMEKEMPIHDGKAPSPKQPPQEKSNPIPEVQEVKKQEEKNSFVPEVSKELEKKTVPGAGRSEEKQAAPEKQPKTIVISFPTPNNQNEEAVLKLEVQLENQKSYMLPVFPIVRYLKNKCLADADFGSKVSNEKKTLEKCFRFVMEGIQKALVGSNGWLDDNEVYALAETYFLIDEAVFEKMEQERKEAEKRRQEEVAKKRKEQEEKRTAAANKPKKQSEEKKSEETKGTAAPTVSGENTMQGQLSLV